MLPLRFPYCCLMLLCLCCLQTLQAQNPKKKTKSDVEVINFGDETDAKKGKEQTYRRIIVKTSPLAFVFGRQPFEVEKEMNDYLSLQVGLGFTFEPLWAGYDDLLSEIRDEVTDPYVSPLWTQDVVDEYTDLSIRSGKLGPMVSVSPRFFFDSDGYEGMYIAPVLRYSAQNYKVQMVSEGKTEIIRLPDQLQKESVKNMDILAHWGGQTLYPKLTLEWFVGAGIRLRNNTRQDIGFNATNLSGNGERQFKDRNLRVEMGLRVGFQL